MISLVPLDIGLEMGLIFAWAVIALAVGFRLLSFPDLTVEGSLPLGGATYAALLKGGFGLPVAITGALFAGAAAGALTALLHVRFQVNKFLSGIIVVAIAYSGGLFIMQQSNIGLIQEPSPFDAFSGLDRAVGGPFSVGTLLLLGLLLAIIGGLLIGGLSTRPGLRLRVAGSNPSYARALGISVPMNLIAGLALTNGMAALSGVLLSANQGFADIQMGAGTLILALAAMAIGERLLPGRHLSYAMFVLLAAVLGSIMYQILIAYAQRLGVPSTYLRGFAAVLILGVVVLRTSKGGSEPLLKAI